MSKKEEKSSFEPCPFCGEVPEPSKHFREELWQLIHRCDVIGSMAIDWRDSVAKLAKEWNVRAPSEQAFDDI